ncbi:MAG: SUMF1/EgtB/PvdO family nonheme iron enzyme [Bacteroidota bacterium]
MGIVFNYCTKRIFPKTVLAVFLCMFCLNASPQADKNIIIPKLPEMVFVAGGTFQMGSKTGGSDKQPVHTVRLDDFYIGKYEVTQAQWKAVMNDDGHLNFFEGYPDCPVERVSWLNAVRFIVKLNALTGEKFRLPTEAEWEFAARGGNHSRSFKYSGSDSAREVAWRSDNAEGMTHPFGLKKPNELGIFDMSGNVWEWCVDWYSESYYTISPRRNPTGPIAGTERVIRGGSWFQDSSGLNVTDRKAVNPEWQLGFVGFRLCK